MAHVQKRGDGRWRARYRGPDGRERSKTFDRRSDAERFLTTVEASKLEGRWTDPRLSKTPFADFAMTWVAARLGIRGATRARDESLIRCHVIERFGDSPIGRIQKRDVQQWVGDLDARGYAPATIRKAHSLLSAIMAEAVEHRLIPESPCRRVSPPRASRAERRFLSGIEVERLVSATPDTYKALIYTASYLGCRWEELAGLKMENLDLLRRQVAIIGTIERTAGTYAYVEEAKTDASRRTLQLPKFLVEILARHLEIAVKSEWVFPAVEGGFLRYDNFRGRVWRPAVRRAELEPLTFHSLRHTAAAIMVDQGADALHVQRRLGHRDIKTTLGLYGHRFPNREHDLNDALGRAFTEARREALAASPRPDSYAEVVDLGAS